MSRLRRAVVQVLMQPVRARGVALPIDLRDELREAYYAEPDEDWRTRAEEAERKLAEARGLLREAQWGGIFVDGYCVAGCGAFSEYGEPDEPHAPDCRLAAVLSDSPAPSPPR